MSRMLTEDEMDQLLLQAETGRLGLSMAGAPYVIPLSFWRRGDAVYFHGAPRGRKVDAMGANNRACFLVDQMDGLQKAERPCEFNVAFRSVLVEGTIEIVVDQTERLEALRGLSAKYGGSDAAARLTETDITGTAVFKLKVQSKSGRANP